MPRERLEATRNSVENSVSHYFVPFLVLFFYDANILTSVSAMSISMASIAAAGDGGEEYCVVASTTGTMLLMDVADVGSWLGVEKDDDCSDVVNPGGGGGVARVAGRGISLFSYTKIQLSISTFFIIDFRV